MSMFCKRFNELKEGINSIQGKPVTLNDINRGVKDRISIQALGKYKKGEATPSVVYAELLADYFGVTLDYLVGKDIYPKKEYEDLYRQFGLTPDILNVLRMLKIMKHKDFDIIIKALEILIKHIGNKRGDALSAIANYLQPLEESQLFLLNETFLDEFEEVLNNTRSVDTIREEYNKLIYAMDADMPKLLHDISNDTVYLQDIQNKLNTLKRDIQSDIEETRANKIDREKDDDVIPVDWEKGTLL